MWKATVIVTSWNMVTVSSLRVFSKQNPIPEESILHELEKSAIPVNEAERWGKTMKK